MLVLDQFSSTWQCLLKKPWERQLWICKWWPSRYILRVWGAMLCSNLSLLKELGSWSASSLTLDPPQPLQIHFRTGLLIQSLVQTSSVFEDWAKLPAESSETEWPQLVCGVAWRDFQRAGFFWGYLTGFSQKVTSGCRSSRVNQVSKTL